MQTNNGDQHSPTTDDAGHTFTEWYRLADRDVAAVCGYGLEVFDDDAAEWDAWNDGESPEDYALTILHDAGFGTGGLSVTRASMLRPGQRIQFGIWWVAITAIEEFDGRIRAHLGDYWPISFDREAMVPVRDTLHTYTDKVT